MCPDLAMLEQYASQQLDADSRGSIEQHLSSCHDCELRLDDVTENLRVVESIRGAGLGTRPVETTPSPKQIDRYRILREIGRGGMGVVYEAEQPSPRRKVALKVLLPWRAREERYESLFLRETRALARLQHPHIGAVYDAGRTAEGTAYLVLELIEGQSLVGHAAHTGLTRPQRLELFRKVCDAIAVAHQRGVIHRDLKPSNVLVHRDGEPKVLDFGLSKIVAADDPSRPSLSLLEPGRIAGTVPYMSPEQIRGDAEAVDVRTDVYALGMLLYELTTEQLPYDVRSVSLPEAARIICQVPPATAPLHRAGVDRDLSAIVLKALEKEPQRRYASAAELREDVDRYLRGEPVSAHPPSTAYQLRKLVARHKLPSALAALLAFVLLATAVGGSVLATRLARERAHALQLGQRESAARREAERQSQIANEVNRFLEEMLASADPDKLPEARNARVQDVLLAAARKLDDGDLEDQPELEAAVRTTVGNVFRSLGHYDDARRHLTRAVELSRELFPDGSAALAYRLNKFARAEKEKGRLAEAEALFREALEMRRRLLGPEHEDVATSLNNLGLLLIDRGQSDEGEALLHQALDMRRRLLGPRHEEIATSLNNLGFCSSQRMRHDEAERYYRESLEMDRAIRGDLHPNVAVTMSNLATALTQLRRHDEAAELLESASQLHFRIHGPDHPGRATLLNNLGQLHMWRGQLPLAIETFHQALDVSQSLQGAGHPLGGTILSNLAVAHLRSDDPATAFDFAARSLSTRLAIHGEDHFDTLSCRFLCALALSMLDRHAEALPHLTAIEAYSKSSGRVIFSSPAFLRLQGECLWKTGNLAAAEPALRQALEKARTAGNTERIAEAEQTLADFLAELSRPHELGATPGGLESPAVTAGDDPQEARENTSEE